MFNPGSLVLLTNGSRAGKKGVVLQVLPKGHDGREYESFLVLGLERAPRQVKKGDVDSLKKQLMKMKPFLKVKTAKDLFLTRYAMKLNVPGDCEKKRVGAEKKEFLKDVQKYLIKFYLEGESVDNSFNFFFRKLKYVTD